MTDADAHLLHADRHRLYRVAPRAVSAALSV